MKINSVRFIEPDDPTEMIDRYTKAVAQFLIKRVPPEHLDLLIKKLREVELAEKNNN